jgi:uncharacterized protein YaiI (UPF0178 family)
MEVYTMIYIDADACPVKEETYKVADRYCVGVRVVTNRWMRTPRNERVVLQVVSGAFDAVDDWIADRAGPGDIVVTADIPLAARCLQAGARALGTRGEEFNEAGIGNALAMRALNDHLRQTGQIAGGQGPLDRKSRSRFLSRLDEMINDLRQGKQRSL